MGSLKLLVSFAVKVLVCTAIILACLMVSSLFSHSTTTTSAIAQLSANIGSCLFYGFVFGFIWFVARMGHSGGSGGSDDEGSNNYYHTNPSTGLPMANDSVDVSGNMFGTNPND